MISVCLEMDLKGIFSFGVALGSCRLELGGEIEGWAASGHWPFVGWFGWWITPGPLFSHDVLSPSLLPPIYRWFARARSLSASNLANVASPLPLAPPTFIKKWPYISPAEKLILFLVFRGPLIYNTITNIQQTHFSFKLRHWWKTLVLPPSMLEII